MKKSLNITREQLSRTINEVISEYLNKETGNACAWNPRKIRMIREGLIMSYPINEVVGILKREGDVKRIGNGVTPTIIRKGQYDRLPYVSKSEKKNERNLNGINELPIIRIEVSQHLNEDGFEAFKNVENACNRCGYFFACLIVNGEYAVKELNESLWKEIAARRIYTEIIFEPKFDATVADEDIPTHCYHICPTRSADKICGEVGLTPHNKGRVSNHPERVYLYLWKPQDWRDIAMAFSESSDCNDFTLLEINMREMIGKTRFRYDPNTYSKYPSAIYTEETIPSKYIKAIDRYLIHY